MQISIFGSGYVGLVTAACLAELGHDILCLDVDQQKIAMLQASQVPFDEQHPLVFLDISAAELSKYATVEKINCLLVGNALGEDNKIINTDNRVALIK